MLLSPEYIAVAILVAALLLFILLRIMNNSNIYKSNKQALLERHQQLRVYSNKLQDSLSSHIMENLVENEPFTEEYTYGDFLKHLQKNHMRNLSDKNYSKIKNTNNRLTLANTKNMLAEQEQKLEDTESKLKVLGL